MACMGSMAPYQSLLKCGEIVKEEIGSDVDLELKLNDEYQLKVEHEIRKYTDPVLVALEKYRARQPRDQHEREVREIIETVVAPKIASAIKIAPAVATLNHALIEKLESYGFKALIFSDNNTGVSNLILDLEPTKNKYLDLHMEPEPPRILAKSLYTISPLQSGETTII